MNEHRISVFQPVGDAASELLRIIPGLGHGDAVVVLRSAEANGRSILDNGAEVIYDRNDYGWIVRPA